MLIELCALRIIHTERELSVVSCCAANSFRDLSRIYHFQNGSSLSVSLFFSPFLFRLDISFVSTLNYFLFLPVYNTNLVSFSTVLFRFYHFLPLSTTQSLSLQNLLLNDTEEEEYLKEKK
ncbi:hypothetical protein, unlikely [Trypanosoma brucei gambiense DAL972]|uniref:Uncharacterized protein n=1 Tax=Trypanosoma brucei gambiense (strain MHOM/CI/86/DAL972) TaxID=679716 RepID=D0A2X1_TRYB9|nr:hypothetical protein, unlikely [Trypanosoma brucei gambiense DAL972]CBH15615.1 hypothetical protein, unlikely [Trypanosoma brucei gambiense DAL972]|eukprot:XP_011777879.1 hypothetical protein, unlikely [Trypanosoma brucei gambiense DAL972]